MGTQLKYALRGKLTLRIVALVVLVLVNAAMVFVSAGEGARALRMTSAFSISGLAFLGIMTVNILCFVDMLRSLFSAPAGYQVFLAPVPAWKILLPRVLAQAVLDYAGYALGVLGILAHTNSLMSLLTMPSFLRLGQSLGLVGIFFLNYLVLVAVVFFSAVLCNSVFSNVKGKLVIGCLLFIGVQYLLSLFNAILIPLGTAQVVGTMVSVTIPLGLNAPMIVSLLLLGVKFALVFAASAYLMERKKNI